MSNKLREEIAEKQYGFVRVDGAGSAIAVMRMLSKGCIGMRKI